MKYGRSSETAMILETRRLYLRKMDQGDYKSLCRILQDPEVMYAYEQIGRAHV